MWQVRDGRLGGRFGNILDPEAFFGMRVHAYRAAVAIWLDSPWTALLGNGPGAYYKLSPQAISGDATSFVSFSHVHNEILENLVEGGIVGLLLYLGIVFSTLCLMLKCAADRSLSESARLAGAAQETALATFQVHGLFSISTRTLVVGHTFYWIVGLSWALGAAVRQGKKVFC